MVISPVGKLRPRERLAPGHRKWGAGSHPPTRLSPPQGTPAHCHPVPSTVPCHSGNGPHPAPEVCPPKPGPGGQDPVGHPPLAGHHPPPPPTPSQLLPPGRCRPGAQRWVQGVAGGSGSPREERDGAGSSGEEKRPAQTLPGEGERGPQRVLGGRRPKPPRQHPPGCRGGGQQAPSSPAAGTRLPPWGALMSPPTKRSPLWSGAGPFRVSSDISRAGIQGEEPRG